MKQAICAVRKLLQAKRTLHPAAELKYIGIDLSAFMFIPVIIAAPLFILFEVHSLRDNRRIPHTYQESC